MKEPWAGRSARENRGPVVYSRATRPGVSSGPAVQDDETCRAASLARHRVNVIQKILSASLFRTAALFALGNLLNAAVAFVLLPILTRHMSPSDYSVAAVYGTVVSLLVPAVGFGINASIFNRYYDRERIDFPGYVTSCLFLLCAATASATALLSLASTPLSRWTFVPPSWIWTAGLAAAGQGVDLVVLALWHTQAWPARYGAYQLAQTFTNVGLSISLVVVLQLGWKGRVAAQFATSVLFGAAGILALRWNGWTASTASGEATRSAVGFGLGIVPHNLASAVGPLANQVLVQNLVGLADSGLYAVAVQVGSLLSIVEYSFNQAWVAWLFERLKTGRSQDRLTIVRLTYLYGAAFLTIAAVFGLLAPALLDVLVGRRFRASSVHVAWIAMGLAFNALQRNMAHYLYFAERTALISTITIFTTILNVGLSYVLILRNGAVGAAQSGPVSWAIAFVVTWALASRVVKMPWTLSGSASDDPGAVSRSNQGV